ncbi:MAG: methyl-accepting chemotaxis protein [Myxococcota bacterium]
MRRVVPLRTRLLLLVAGILVTISVFLFLFFPAQTRELAQRSMERKASAVISLVARSAQAAFDFDDEQAAQRILDRLEVDPEVLYAVIVRGDRSQMASFSRLPGRLDLEALTIQPGERPTYQRRDGTLHTAIVLGGGDVGGSNGASDPPVDGELTQPLPSPAPLSDGALYLGLSLHEIGTQVGTSRRSAMWTCIGIFLIGMLVAFVVGTSVTEQLRKASIRIAQVSSDMYAATQEQEAAGTEQSSSVQEITQTMQSLTESAKHIADSAQEVLDNAEKTRQTTDETASKIAELSSHANRISEILETIRDIADRSDLLALNASLEATRAGEAGRAFSLVAAEMRRLAEHVTDSVQVVKGLVADVRGSGAESVVAIEDNRKLVESTTESSRRINMVTQQQRAVTEQISQSMRDIASVIAQAVLATQQMRGSAESLKNEAAMLATLVGQR